MAEMFIRRSSNRPFANRSAFALGRNQRAELACGVGPLGEPAAAVADGAIRRGRAASPGLRKKARHLFRDSASAVGPLPAIRPMAGPGETEALFRCAPLAGGVDELLRYFEWPRCKRDAAVRLDAAKQQRAFGAPKARAQELRHRAKPAVQPPNLPSTSRDGK